MDDKKDMLYLALIALLAFTVLGGPLAVRMYTQGSTIMQDEPYYHSRISQEIIEKGFPERDTMVIGGRPYMPEPYHAVLASFGKLISVDLASKLLPVIGGVLAIALFYSLLKRLGASLEPRTAACLLLLLTPAFIYTFTVSNSHAVALPLILLAFLLYLQKNRYAYLLSVLLFTLSSVFGLIPLVSSILLLLSYMWHRRSEASDLGLIVM
ncbi:hypothetical protein GF351_00420, partial [Candidatus Woesearchaeota archaeon]|nr:hypothetical protein [Candidatus Woesearchaeota archaeon]